MKRNEFLKGMGILGVGALLPLKNALANEPVPAAKATSSCVLIPSETEGPFPLDLTTDHAATYFRQDIREDRTGTELHVKLKITGLDNCLPMANVRVNIWHCDKDGIYSGYDTAMNPGGSATTTWLRGYQMTDANGGVEFITIFPGHYDSRVTHIHFQVYVSSVYKAVSQFTWDPTVKNNFYTAHSSVYTHGVDPQDITTDNVFSDGYALQLATLTDNGDGTYTSYIEATINGTGALGLANYEGETGGQFKLCQNFPNPHEGYTTIPFTINNQSDVEIDIYDLSAKKLGSLQLGSLSTGDHTAAVNFDDMGIASGTYLYQIQVTNSKGTFRQCKMMTAAK